MMESSNREMDKQDGAIHTISSNNIRPPSLAQTPPQNSASDVDDPPSISVHDCTDSISRGEAAEEQSQTATTHPPASPAAEGCLIAEKGILVKGSIDRKQDGKSKKRDQKPVDLLKRPDIKVVKVTTAEGVEVVVEKQELLSIPQTNFAIGLLVMCCFNPPFGLLALYFSLKAAAAYRDGKKAQGARCARMSIVISLLGIMLMMVIISSVVLYIAVNKHSARRGQRRMNSASLGF